MTEAIVWCYLAGMVGYAVVPLIRRVIAAYRRPPTIPTVTPPPPKAAESFAAFRAEHDAERQQAAERLAAAAADNMARAKAAADERFRRAAERQRQAEQAAAAAERIEAEREARRQQREAEARRNIEQQQRIAADWQARWNAEYQARSNAFNATYQQFWQQAQQQSYAYQAPPYQAPRIVPKPEWAIVLGVEITATREQIETAYRKAVKTAHPDAGGSHEAMLKLNKAVAEARKARAAA